MEKKKPVATPTKERRVLGDVGQSSPSVSTEINAGGQDHVSENLTPSKRKSHMKPEQHARQPPQPTNAHTDMLDAHLANFTKKESEPMEVEPTAPGGQLGVEDSHLDDMIDKKEKAMAPQLPTKKKKKTNNEMELEEDGKEAAFVEEQKSAFNKVCTKVDHSFLYKGERRTADEALYVNFEDQLGASKLDGAAGFVRGVHNITCALFLDNNSIPMNKNFMQNILVAEKDDDEKGTVMNYEEFWKWIILEAQIDIIALAKYFNEMVHDRFDCLVYGTVILKNHFLKCKGIVYSTANAIIATRILDEKYGTNDNIKCFGCLKFQGDGLLYDVTLYKEIEKNKRKYPGLRERKNYAQN